MNAMTAAEALAGRADFETIAGWVKPRSVVLDLGCGDGSLLAYLHGKLGVRGYGVDISDDNVLACVQNGVNVIQSDLERGLAGFDAGSFDCVILSQTLQTMRRIEGIVSEMLRVGREGIVTFPNMGHWQARLQFLAGRMPKSDWLPYEWYDTPNIHLCTVDDFEAFCAAHAIRIKEKVVLHGGRRVTLLPNLMGTLAVFRFEKA
jgi:methionine biosynthesis protein MetW